MSHAWDTFAILMCGNDHSESARDANNNKNAKHIVIQKHGLVFILGDMECTFRLDYE